MKDLGFFWLVHHLAPCYPILMKDHELVRLACHHHSVVLVKANLSRLQGQTVIFMVDSGAASNMASFSSSPISGNQKITLFSIRSRFPEETVVSSGYKMVLLHVQGINQTLWQQTSSQ